MGLTLEKTKLITRSFFTLIIISIQYTLEMATTVQIAVGHYAVSELDIYISIQDSKLV